MSEEKCPKCGKRFETVAFGRDYTTYGCPVHREFDRVIYERILTIKMKGDIRDINSYCERVGEVANEHDIEVEFT